MTTTSQSNYAVIEYVPEFVGFAVWHESEAYRAGQVYADHGWYASFSPFSTADEARVWAEGQGMVIVETKTRYQYHFEPATMTTSLVGWSN
jgi:predicted membrane-bound dolichyl-phosphate-mannose-protein mannosyltransferase